MGFGVSRNRKHCCAFAIRINHLFESTAAEDEGKRTPCRMERKTKYYFVVSSKRYGKHTQESFVKSCLNCCWRYASNKCEYIDRYNSLNVIFFRSPLLERRHCFMLYRHLQTRKMIQIASQRTEEREREKIQWWSARGTNLSTNKSI